MPEIGSFKKNRLDTDYEGSFWPVFTDVIMAALMLLIFTTGYQSFTGSDHVNQLSVRTKQDRFLKIFKEEFQQEMTAGQIQSSINGNLQRLSFGGGMLFNSGADTLNENGIWILQRCLNVFNFIGDDYNMYRKIQVAGHTDSVRVSPTLWAGGIKDNWDLSASRANNIVRYFINNSNLDRSLFSSSAHSWYQWKEDEPISENRKVEILLIYDEDR